jgi:putative SOS response-associated peptidase YedK
MCERFLLLADGRELANAFELADVPQIAARYNIAPAQTVPIVLQVGPERILRALSWGLFPSWSKDPSIGFRAPNARCETVKTKPAIRAAFRKHRCLIPASGYYEWKTEGERKQPILFRPREGLFALTGLWDRWKGGDGTRLETFTILTTTANEVVRPTCDRMPVILDRADYGTWLDSATRGLAKLLRPYRAEAMTATPVDSWVNDARHEGPQCIEPVDDQHSLFVGDGA